MTLAGFWICKSSTHQSRCAALQEQVDATSAMQNLNILIAMLQDGSSMRSLGHHESLKLYFTLFYTMYPQKTHSQEKHKMTMVVWDSATFARESWKMLSQHLVNSATKAASLHLNLPMWLLDLFHKLRPITVHPPKPLEDPGGWPSNPLRSACRAL